jgi:hypothetical protein
MKLSIFSTSTIQFVLRKYVHSGVDTAVFLHLPFSFHTGLKQEVLEFCII